MSSHTGPFPCIILRPWKMPLALVFALIASLAATNGASEYQDYNQEAKLNEDGYKQHGLFANERTGE